MRRTTAEAAITVTAAAAGAEVPVVGGPASFAVSAFEEAVLTAVVAVPEVTTVEAEDEPAEFLAEVFPVVADAGIAAAVRVVVTGGSGRLAATAVVGIAGTCVTGCADVVYVTCGVVSAAPWLP